MKIEKVNDHQIRCTLTKADLADRELKISELAYGTEKAKELFRDMMQQASIKFGFEADDIPLMIEAVPLNADCIVLIITKVEDPEELDTRFSKFAPFVHDDEEDSNDNFLTEDLSHTGEEVLDLFKKIKEHAASLAKSSSESDAEPKAETIAPVPAKPAKESAPVSATRIFAFRTLQELFKPAAYVTAFYDGDNYLYKDTYNNQYLLVVTRVNDSNETFNKTCNILSEYGQLKKGASGSDAFLAEHYDLIIGPDALQKLNI